MSAGEKLKWFLIRRWPPGYRALSAVTQLVSGEQRRELEAARSLLDGLVPTGGLVFDVGANHGRRTDAYLRLGARVVAIEPQPHCLERLRARFGHRADVAIVPSAVGPDEGKVTLHIGGDDQISTLADDWRREAENIPELAALGWVDEIEVGMTTLDRLIDEHGLPDFTKLDVEGFELQALRGCTRPLPLLSFEHTYWRAEPSLDCMAYLATLGDYRYRFSEGESMTFAEPDDWVDQEAMAERLSTRYSRDEDGYGDVYARLWSG